MTLRLAFVAAVLLLAFPLLAAGRPVDGYTAAIAPADAQPGAAATYSLTLTNKGSSPDSASQAAVGVPAGFSGPTELTATTSAVGACTASTWTATFDAAAAQISAVSPGTDASRLCPGATLTIQFRTTAPSATGTYAWNTQLTNGATSFAISGPQPRVTVDATRPPPPTLTQSPTSPSASASATFAFTDADSEATFSCRLDDAAASPCTSPTSYSSLADGPHVFGVKATDAAGNVSDETTYSWQIDTVAPPQPTLDTQPPNVTNMTSATFSFSDTEAGVAFQCRLDGAAFSPCSSPASYSGLAEGGHSFDVRALDAAGNASAAASASWTIDTTRPVVTIDSGPADPTNATSARFDFRSDKEGTFACSLDGEGFTACSSPATYSGLLDGRHSFEVKATDGLGTTGLPTRYEWTVDTTAPPPPAVAGGPATPTNRTTASFVFADSEANLTFRCQLDGAAATSCTSPASYAALASGPHTFKVTAVDAAGNASAAASYGWVVDLVPPDTTIASHPGAIETTAPATFAFTSSEGGSAFRCSLDGAAPAPCATPQTYGSLAVGPHSFTVAAVDAAGNVDPTPASYAWTVAAANAPDTTPPARVGRLAVTVGYGTLRLSWSRPPDADFDHVVVFESTSARGPLRASVYNGRGTSYTSRRFRNGSYVRFGVVSYDRAGNHSATTVVAVSPAALLRSPRDGSVVSRPPLLAWTNVAKAAYYNVQLYRGSQKVLSAWPSRPWLQLRRGWTYAGGQRLQPGTYRWFVWPGFGARAQGRYGQVLGYGSFVVR